MPKFNLSLTAKLLLVNAVIVIAVVGMIVAGLFFTHDIGEQLSSIINEDLVKLSNNANLGKDLGNMFAEPQLFINSFIERQDHLEQEQDRLIRFLDDRITPLTTYEDNTLLQTLQAFKRDLQALFEQSAKLVENSRSFMLLLVGISVVTMLRPIKRLAGVAEQLSQGDISDNTDLLSRRSSRDAIGTLSRFFQKLIVHNRKVAATAAEIAQGNLTADFMPRSEKDVLGHALFNMSNHLKEIAAIATAIGDGDLRNEIEPKTEHDILGHAFQRLKSLHRSISDIVQSAAQLKNASGDLYHISEKMVASTQQSSQKAQTVSRHSRQIDENVNAAATATEEMSASIREISRNSSNIVDIGGTAVERANSANTIIKDLERQSIDRRYHQETGRDPGWHQRRDGGYYGSVKHQHANQ